MASDHRAIRYFELEFCTRALSGGKSIKLKNCQILIEGKRVKLSILVVRVWCVKGGFTFVCLHTWQGSESRVKRRRVVEKGWKRNESRGETNKFRRYIGFVSALVSFPREREMSFLGINFLVVHEDVGEYLWLRICFISRNVRDVRILIDFLGFF